MGKNKEEIEYFETERQSALSAGRKFRLLATVFKEKAETAEENAKQCDIDVAWWEEKIKEGTDGPGA